MYTFSYWHIYYDSAFLTPPPKLINALYLDLKIGSRTFQWPHLTKLPQLTRVYELLQRLIQKQQNWSESLCSEEELYLIETKLNQLAINLQCQKKYGEQFWYSSPRRIQSSIVHFFIFLKSMIYILLPVDCQNIAQAKSQQKLVLELSALQKFVNQLIKLIRPIHSFMFHQPDLEEQLPLIKEFFDQFTYLLKELPRMNKQELLNVPKLMEYINLVNRQESSKFISPDTSPTSRRRSRIITEFDFKTEKNASQEKDFLQKSDNSNKVDLTKNIKKNNKKKDAQIDKKQHKQNVIDQLKLFRFKDEIKRILTRRKGKKHTVSSLSTTKDKTERSLTQDRTQTFSMFEDPQNSGKIKRTQTLEETRPKNQSFFFEGRSRQLTSRTMMSKRSTIFVEEEQKQQERKDKVGKKKEKPIPLRAYNFSYHVNVSDGKRTGWGVLREWLRERVAQRKLKRLLYS